MNHGRAAGARLSGPVIALDVMGGDFGPQVALEGAALAASEGIQLILVGEADVLASATDNWPEGCAEPELVPSSASVAMAQSGARAFRARDTSVRVAAELVHAHRADAMMSVGNTGAVFSAALSVLGPLPGVDRPALGVTLPSTSRYGFLLLDAGANREVHPEQYVQFARLGSAFMAATCGIERPSVALLSIGEEPTKGTVQTVRAHELLAGAAGINFVGNIESRDIFFAPVDVVVTDGFTGNVVVKLIEGLTQFLFGAFDQAVDPAELSEGEVPERLQVIREALTAETRGAVPLLGIDGNVFVGHGRSTAKAIASGIRVAAAAASSGVLNDFRAVLAVDRAPNAPG